ncbi:6937_t:CDS:1, partial [Cetraspora pellucida]
IKSEHDAIVRNYQNKILTLKEKELKKQENDLEVILKLKKENKRLKNELIDYENIKNKLIKYENIKNEMLKINKVQEKKYKEIIKENNNL